jgi:hypothetical protein
MIVKSGWIMSSVKVSGVLVLLSGLFFVQTGFAEIYKWVDEEGNVHFGDCPPSSCASEEVRIAPTPPNQTKEETQERFKRLKAYQEKLGKNRKKDLNRTGKSEASPPPDAECFSSLTEAWNGKLPDIHEEIKPSPLSKAELQRLESLFRALKGRWRGNMVDTQCINPAATPAVKSYHYSFRLDARWEADRLFKLEADLEADDSEGDLRRQFFWILLRRDGLRFRKTRADLPSGLDRPRFDVEILRSGQSAIVFFLRRGGALRRTNVFSLHRLAQGFTISEFYYVQGALAGKRLWTIER